MPLQEAGDKANEALDVLSELLHDALMVSASSAAAPAHARTAAHTDLAERIALWAAAAGHGKLADIAQRVTEARELIDGNVIPRTALERVALAF
jgi:hypothetical protein